MSAATPATGERAELVEARDLPRRRRRRMLSTAAVVLVLVAAGAYVERTNPGGISLSHPLGIRHHTTSGRRENTAATSVQTVERRSLSQTTSVPGTLGYAGDYTVLGRGHGTVTWLPAAGQVIGNGQVLYRVDGRPVVLLYGSTPAYRALAAGAEASDVTGTDVRQLNRDLVALGYAASSVLNPNSDEFNWATSAALHNLLTHVGVTDADRLALGGYVFEPGPVRVTRVSATLGGPAGGPILKGTSTARQVTVDLDASQQSQVKAGDGVSITLPNNRATPGTVTSVGTVATTPPNSGSAPSDGTPTVTVEITPTDPRATGTLDQSPVQVAITTATVHSVLAVRVDALLALSSGGYAVEVIDTGGRRLVPVHLGLFDDADGLVQVTGAGLAAGQRVVVPAT